MGMLANGSHTINGGDGSSASNKPSIRSILAGFCVGKDLGKYKKACAVFTLLVGFGCIICGVLVVFLFRDFVDGIIKSEIPLLEGSRITKVWQKPPIRPYLKFHFFNVTNPKRFLRGAKPILQEIGPFTYQEAWEKVNVTWSDHGNKVTFGQKKTYFFRPDLSVANEDTLLILPNLPMLTALAAVKSVPESESVIRVALGSMLEILKQEPFVPLTVKDILWGYENPLIQLGRGIFPEEQAYPFDEFGLFVGKNDTFPGLLTTMTGKNNVYDVGQVYAWDGDTELDFWQNGTHCNDIKGTDGSTFHPDIKKNETLYIFNRDLCRSIPLVYQKDIVSDGIPGYRFVPPEDVFAPPEENPDNECFCMVDEGCNVPRGLFNMSACQFGSPVMMSWAHFFQADPSLLEDVIGLSPDEDSHQFFIDLQPKLGTSLRAQARSQINIQMYKIDDVKPAEGLRDMVFPFLWFSDGIESIDDADTLNLLHTAVHAPEKARNALYPAFFVVGVICIFLVFSYLGYHNFHKTVRSEQITPRRIDVKESKNGNSKTEAPGVYEMKAGSNGGVLASS